MSEMQTEATVLDVKGLKTVFFTNSGLFKAVDDVSFSVRRGETLAIVGESGCGKSTLAKVLAGLETASAGRVQLEGIEVATTRVESRPLALKRTIQMVFQNPDSTLNPSHSVGYAIGRALRRLRRLSGSEAAREVARLARRFAGPRRRHRLFQHDVRRPRMLVEIRL